MTSRSGSSRGLKQFDNQRRRIPIRQLNDKAANDVTEQEFSQLSLPLHPKGEQIESEGKALPVAQGVVTATNERKTIPDNAISTGQAPANYSSSDRTTGNTKKLPVDETPEGRLLRYGAKRLSGIELLSVVIGGDSEKARQSATDIIRELDITDTGYMGTLRNLRIQELELFSGIGQAKAMRIIAAVELGKRAFNDYAPKGAVVDDPAVAAKVLANQMMWQTQEKFAVVCLNTHHSVIGSEIISKGSATETIAHPRDIFTTALKMGATRLVIAHNHPSGELTPSKEDIELTKQLLKCSDMMGIPLLDHLILGNGDWSSLRTVTKLWNEQGSI